MPQTLFWVGGHSNNDADNALNWNPQAIPVTQDVLEVTGQTSATINAHGGGLAGDDLSIYSPASTVNLTHSAAARILDEGVSGTTVSLKQDSGVAFLGSGDDATINLVGGNETLLMSLANSTTTLNLANNTEWAGSFAANNTSVTTTSGHHASFINNAADSIGDNSNVVLSMAVTGNGSFF